VILPDGVSERQAAAIMAKGLTASTILHRLYTITSGDVVLSHAAAGGMGTIGSAEKAKAARDNGCDHTILYRETDFVAAVRKLVPGGVAAVFDAVGKDTFLPSLDCLRPY